MNGAPLSDLLIQASIKTENTLMDFSDSSWQDCPDTGRSTGSYIIFYQGVTIDHGIHIPGPVSQQIEESTVGMALAHFRVLIHELLKKDSDIVPEEDPLLILDMKSAVCTDNNVKYTKETSHIARILHFLRNG